MGLKYGHTYSYIFTERSANEVYRIALARLEKRNKKYDNETLHRQQPTIDIDVSLLIRSRNNTNIKSNATYLLNFGEALLNVGFDVMMVFDGNTRHHSKRATTQRQADAKRKKIEIVIRKSELMRIAQRRRTLDSIDERNKLCEEEADIKKRIKILENYLQQTTINVGDKLLNAFKESTKKLTSSKINRIKYCQSVYQADSIMAGRIIAGASEILLTSDSDQLALLGSKCVCIKKWRFQSQQKTKTIDCLDIFTANKSTMEDIMNLLKLPFDSPKLKPPKFPIFDNINCHRLRSLIAVGLGCDCNMNPIVSPAKLLQFIKHSTTMQNISDNDAYFAIKKIYIQQHNISDKRSKRISKSNNIVSDNIIDSNNFSKMIDILMDAFIYEPTITTTTDKTIQFTYIHTAPPNNILHPYIEDFIKTNNNDPTNSSTEVVDCCLCIGTGEDCHLFLEAEGFCSCTGCGQVCCLDCICQNKIGENKFCYKCFLPEMSVNTTQIELTLTSTELRDELRKYGVEETLEDDNNELFEVYEAIKINPLHDNTSSIKYPIKPANFLPQLEAASIISFHFKDGGLFVVDEKLESEQILQIMTIMAGLVSMYDKKKQLY